MARCKDMLPTLSFERFFGFIEPLAVVGSREDRELALGFGIRAHGERCCANAVLDSEV